MRLVWALIGIIAGAIAGWFLPSALIPRPHEFDFLAIIGWRIVLVPAGAALGLIIGLVSSKPQAKNDRDEPPDETIGK
jgi:hypothetical protein